MARPTLEELRWLEAAAKHQKSQSTCHATIRGCWDDNDADFQLKIEGDMDDIIETFESLQLNGNLCEISLTFSPEEQQNAKNFL